MNEESNRVIIILGPSASGKSEIALVLAGELGASIISADAFQIYRGMDIGTAKPSKECRRQIKHYLIDVAETDEDFDVARFKALAEEAIRKIKQQGKTPLVVGGTGLYIKALTRGLVSAPKKNKKLRDKLEKLEKNRGEGFLHQRLKKVDPEAARRIHPHDQRRIIRALEVYELTGLPLSRIQKDGEKPDNRFEFIKIGLMRPRKELYKRAEERIDEMFKQGWIEEVRTLLDKNYQPRLVSMHALGYQEISRFLAGKITLEKAKSLIKQNTRQFIKRQLTWFKKETDIHWINIDKNQRNEEILLQIRGILERR